MVKRFKKSILDDRFILLCINVRKFMFYSLYVLHAGKKKKHDKYSVRNMSRAPRNRRRHRDEKQCVFDPMVLKMFTNILEVFIVRKPVVITSVTVTLR